MENIADFVTLKKVDSKKKVTKNNMSDSKNTFWTVIKTTTFLICLAGFAANSFMIFQQFLGKQTLTSEDVQNIGELSLPSITFCGVTGFKERITKLRDLERDNYDNKTLAIEDILLDVEYSDSGDVITIEKLRENTTSWKMTTTYSPYKGRCHTIRYIPKVNDIQFTFSPSNNIIFSV